MPNQSLQSGSISLRISDVTYTALFAVMLLLVSLPVLLTEVVPLADYPNHLARVHVWMMRDTELAVPFLSPVMALQPNMTFDAVVIGLANLFPLEIAGKIFVILTLLAMALGPAILGRAVSGYFSWWSFLPFLFVFNRIFFWGFLGYLFTLGVAIGVSALWVRYEPRRNWLLGFLVRAVTAFLVLAGHLYAFAVLCLLVVFLTLREVLLSESRDSLMRVGKTLSLKWMPLIFPLPLFIYFSPGGINNQVQHPTGKVPRWASTTNNSRLKNERRSC